MIPFKKWPKGLPFFTNTNAISRLEAPRSRLREESLHQYCAGGYHPVRLGDLFNSKYEVQRKLGYGAYSTVWLAKDLA
jgi:serine/threonine protein kinase